MRHNIEIRNRICRLESYIDNDDMASYATLARNSLLKNRIEALEFFIFHCFDNGKINTLQESCLSSIKKAEISMNESDLHWRQKEYYSDEIEIRKAYISECEWVLQDTELDKIYKDDIIKLKKQVKELNKNIKYKQSIIYDIERENNDR